MIDLLYAGWKAAQLWSKWTEKPPGTMEGTIQELKEMTEALYEDNQRLIEVTQDQGRRLDLLQKWLTAAFAILILELAAICWILFAR